MKAHLSERAQVILVWWALTFMFIFGFALWVLLDMVPPPSAKLPAGEIAQFYRDNAFRLKLGAMLASWTSAFMVPLAVVIAAQMLRLEKGIPVWSILQLVGGALMSMFLVFPPIIWGVAAFNPDRAPEATALMHELGSLTLVTTDQFYMFQMFAIVYFSLARPQDELSPFPRWIGWVTLWAAIIFEVGPVAFLFKGGPFAWDGLFVFWFPFVSFGLWVTVMSVSLLSAIKRQRAALGGVTLPAHMVESSVAARESLI